MLIAIAALGVSVYDAVIPPAGARPEQPSLAEARLFMLLPGGKVEITDAWGRRVFQWDGRNWVERASTPPAHPR